MTEFWDYNSGVRVQRYDSMHGPRLQLFGLTRTSDGVELVSGMTMSEDTGQAFLDAVASIIGGLSGGDAAYDSLPDSIVTRVREEC